MSQSPHRMVRKIYQNSNPGAAFGQGRTWREHIDHVLSEVHGLGRVERRWLRDLAREDWQAMGKNQQAGAIPATLKRIDFERIGGRWVTRRHYSNTEMFVEKPLADGWTVDRALAWLQDGHDFTVRTVRNRDGHIAAARAWNGPPEPVRSRGQILRRRRQVEQYLGGMLRPAWLPEGVDTQGIDLGFDL